MESLKNAWNPNEYRPLKPDDEFFQDGNNFCFNDNVNKYTCPVMDDSYSNLPKNASRDIMCEVRNCKKTFDSLFLYELHYNMLHRDVCSHCNVHLPTTHLLDLHINERHGNPTNFKCILPDCLESFSTSKLRKDHVIKVHRYPSNFRYFIYLGGQQIAKTVSKEDSKSAQNIPDNSATEDVTIVNEGMDDDDDDDAGTTVGNNMNVGTTEGDRMDAADNTQVPNLNRRVPANICFGKASHRGFAHRKYRK